MLATTKTVTISVELPDVDEVIVQEIGLNLTRKEESWSAKALSRTA